MLKDKRVWAGVAVVLLGVGAWLAFGFFGIHKAIVDDEVAEDGPVFASGAQLDDAEPSSNAVVETTDAAAVATSAEPDTSDGVDVAESTVDESTGLTQEATSTTAAPTTATPAQPSVITEKTGSFKGLKNYSVSGTANILSDGQQRFLRFEDGFDSTNGPDLKVYLRAENGEFINLGKLKGNKGSQNYEVDISVDLAKYNKVEVWCERFSVGFGSANLT